MFKATLNLYVDSPVQFMAMERIAQLLNGFDWDYHTNHNVPQPVTKRQMKHLADLRRNFCPAPATPGQPSGGQSDAASPHRLTPGNVQFSDGSHEELS